MALGENLKNKKPAKNQKAGTSTKTSEEDIINQETEVKSDAGSDQAEVLDQQGEEHIADESMISVDDRKQLVIFPIDREEYAFDIDKVKEVVSTPPIAKVPHVENYILGVANIRGNVMAIVDLRQVLGMHTESDHSDLKYLMVINDDVYQIAMAVSKVPETLVIDEKEIGKPDGVMMKNTEDQRFLKGIIRRDKRMIMLLDIMEMFGEVRS